MFPVSKMRPFFDPWYGSIFLSILASVIPGPGARRSDIPRYDLDQVLLVPNVEINPHGSPNA